MTRPEIRIYIGDGNFIDRKMNDLEFDQYLIDQEEVLKAKEAQKLALAKKEEILNRLGITAEEAKLILNA